MDKLSDRVKRLGSQTFVMSNKAREMKANGIDYQLNPWRTGF
jgi:aspartate aminotransferase